MVHPHVILAELFADHAWTSQTLAKRLASQKSSMGRKIAQSAGQNGLFEPKLSRGYTVRLPCNPQITLSSITDQ